MAEYLIQDTTLTSLADSIRGINNSTSLLTFSEMKSIVDEGINREDGMLNESVDSIINNRVTNIRKYGFYQNSTLKNISLPLVVNIEDYSFYKCSELTSSNLPLVENIGNFSFKGCTSLISANYPLAIYVGQGCFDECTALSSVNLPLVTEIKPLTFRKCESLNTVDLSAVTSIGTQAFYDSGITSLTLRSSIMVTLENEDAFYFTPIEEGTGNIYVPSNLVENYKAADGWSTYANQIRAIV